MLVDEVQLQLDAEQPVPVDQSAGVDQGTQPRELVVEARHDHPLPVAPPGEPP